MVNVPKNHLSPLPAGICGKSTKKSTCRCHHANEGKSGFEAERVRALGALRSLRSKKKLLAEKRQETHFLSNDKKQKWIKNDVKTETAVATRRVQDAETARMQELNDRTTAGNVGVTTGMPETKFELMLNAIGDSLSDLASSDEEQDGEDEEYDEHDTELGTLSDDDEPGWVMGAFPKTVQHRLESFRQKQMKLHELTQPGWVDAANYFRGMDMKYRTTELKVPVVLKRQIDMTAAAPSPTTFGEHMQTLDTVRGQLPITAVTSRPGSRQMRLRSEKPQAQKFIQVSSADAGSDSMPIPDTKPVEPGSFYQCMKHPLILTI